MKACFAGLLLLTVGCVNTQPPPDTVSGPRLTPAWVAFIQSGRTTRAEVLARLGTNGMISVSHPATNVTLALGYPWQGDTAWHAWQASSTYGVAMRDQIWRAYFLAFNADDIVMAAGFRTLAGDKSASAQLSDWAARQ